jgi:hypothetical protein
MTCYSVISFDVFRDPGFAQGDVSVYRVMNITPSYTWAGLTRHGSCGKSNERFCSKVPARDKQTSPSEVLDD